MGPENTTHVGILNLVILKEFNSLRYVVEVVSSERKTIYKYQINGCDFFKEQTNWLAKAFIDYVKTFYDLRHLKCPSKPIEFVIRKAQPRPKLTILVPPIFNIGDSGYVDLSLKAKALNSRKFENIFFVEEHLKFI